GYFVAPFVFVFLGAQDSYLELALTYINIILLGNVFFMVNFACNAVLNAYGDTKTYRNSLIFGFFANIALNPVFMYGFLFIPAMGLKGIALSTIFVQILVMLYLVKKVFDYKFISFHNLKMYLPDKRIYMEFLKQGLPASLNIVIMGLGAMILMHFISDYGYKAVAGYGIAYRIEAIVIMPALGLSTAVLIIISNNFGAKKYNRVFETLNTAMKYGFYFCLAGAVFILVFAEILIKYFDTDAAVVEFGLTYLIIQVWVFFGLVSLYICVSTLQAIKKPKMIFYIGLYRQIFAHIVVAGLVVKYFELDIKFLWFGILIMVYSAAIYLYFYTKKILEESTHLAS
ncbi:MAG: MATE family efflux transporter, partial [Campylobacteraceae bacterium]|nr:MATE family efflux transporter [Campylobacteraceae bacterium]